MEKTMNNPNNFSTKHTINQSKKPDDAVSIKEQQQESERGKKRARSGMMGISKWEGS